MPGEYFPLQGIRVHATAGVSLFAFSAGDTLRQLFASHTSVRHGCPAIAAGHSQPLQLHASCSKVIQFVQLPQLFLSEDEGELS